jgi:NAD(P)-dependent dehydrogenase (short-subunit alcohol dehydrogenase family)
MGLIGFAKTLSRKLGQYNIRGNAIAPGAVAAIVSNVFFRAAQAQNTKRLTKKGQPR